MPVLYDPKEERFAQLIVRGAKPNQAKVDAGYSTKRPLKSLMGEARIRDRIAELMDRAANKAVLSRSDILERIAEDWEKARSLGQMSAALKAAEMLGKETHKMFVDRKEIGNAGEFDNQTEDQLRQYIETNIKALNLTPRQISALDDGTSEGENSDLDTNLDDTEPPVTSPGSDSLN